MTFDTGSIFSVSIQPLTMPHLSAQSNIFSLSPDDGPLYMISAEIWWTDPARDDYFERALRDLHDTAIQFLRRNGLFHPWIYPNYAARWQNPYDALRPQVRDGLRAIRDKHDAEKVWSTLVPGIWPL